MEIIVMGMIRGVTGLNDFSIDRKKERTSFIVARLWNFCKVSIRRGVSEMEKLVGRRSRLKVVLF
jgi:hypothetical protein